MPELNEKEEENTKSIGGQIDADLYWAFKAEIAKRKETTQKALEIAIRLYLDVAKGEER